MPKRKCKFSDSYTAEWSFIKRGRNDGEAFCSVCASYLSISHSGKASITDHIGSSKHKAKFGIASTSASISSFFVQRNSKQEQQICAAELTTAYKVINHHQSFNSLDCVTKLNTLFYPDSEIASKQSTARTKGTALVNNVLSPYSLQLVIEALKTVSFYGISTDASNHKAEKIFPLLVHYFTEEEGLQIKLIKIQNLPNETSDTITAFCVKTLENCHLPLSKLVAFGADNTNTNFGGRQRNGTNNIFYKLKMILDKEIEGIGCPAHILHNAISTAADVLDIDIESIVLKIFKYFSIFTVRTERLKEFCENSDVTYAAILSHSRSRWISLVPAINRILKLWIPLKEYFDKEEKAPKVIKDFFESNVSQLYTYFVHSQALLVENYIKKIEKKSITIIEVGQTVDEVLSTLNNRFKENFVGTETEKILSNENNGLNSSQIEKFKENVYVFFSTITEYLEIWAAQFKPFTVFKWMILDGIPQWSDVQKTILYLSGKNIVISDSCFEEFVYLKSYIENSPSDFLKKSVPDKWKTFFKSTEVKERKENLLRMVQYLFSVPGHNANVERVFSLISSQWTKERNLLSIGTIESIIMCKFNFNMKCMDFYNFIKNNSELLAKVKSSEKYDWAKPN